MVVEISDDKEKEVKTTERCLLQSGITYPQPCVWACKFCPARSDMVGDLGKLCQAT